VGRAFCARAAAGGYKVIAIGRNRGALDALPSKVDRRKIADLAATEFARHLDGVEIIIHLADQADRAAIKHDSLSPRLMESVVAAARRAGVTDIIFASSMYASLDERGFPNLYGRGKRGAEKILNDAKDPRGIILRLPPVYGPGSVGSITSLSRLVAKNLPLPFKGATAPRDYLFIDNLVDLLLAIVSSPAQVRERTRNRVFEPSDGEAVGTRQLVELIAKAMSRKARMFSIPDFILRPVARAIGRQAQVDAAFDPMVSGGNHDLLTIFGWEPRQQMPQSLGFLRFPTRGASASHGVA
jgi:UDP-glucose 4-epimerase